MQTNILPDVWEDEVGAETKSLRLTRADNTTKVVFACSSLSRLSMGELHFLFAIANWNILRVSQHVCVTRLSRLHVSWGLTPSHTSATTL